MPNQQNNIKSTSISNLDFNEVVQYLESNGYELISIPVGYNPSIDLSNYSGANLFLYLKEIDGISYFVEVNKFTNETDAQTAAEENQCTRKWHSSGETTGCFDPGNDCKVVYNDQTKKYDIICCN